MLWWDMARSGGCGYAIALDRSPAQAAWRIRRAGSARQAMEKSGVVERLKEFGKTRRGSIASFAESPSTSPARWNGDGGHA